MKEYLTLEDVKESWDNVAATSIVSLTRDGHYYLVSRRGGRRIYTESPEEQGRGNGPRLLRVFTDAFDAHRYREALEVYAGETLEVTSMTVPEIKRFTVHAVYQGCRVQVCEMPTGEWPRPVVEFQQITAH